MEHIHNITNSKTKRNYLASIRRFGKDTNLDDFDEVSKFLEEQPISVRVNMIKAMYIYSNKDERYKNLMLQANQSYTASLIMKKRDFNIDWNKILGDMYERRKMGKNHLMIYVWGLMMAYYPRRFGDYKHISTINGVKMNYWDKKDKTITFNVSKNSKSLHCGDKVVKLDDCVHKWLCAYVTKYNVVGYLFDVSEQTLRELMKKNNIPNTIDNRKCQETLALKSGNDPQEVANRFNHSLVTQQVYYYQ